MIRLGTKWVQSANHRDRPCDFWQSRRLNVFQSTNHRDHPCTFKKLGTKSKILVNYMDHLCTLLINIFIRLFKQTSGHF
ncbi:hypothetical protein Hanom_Chr05g00415761 [Helianthus anomalus]